MPLGAIHLSHRPAFNPLGQDHQNTASCPDVSVWPASLQKGENRVNYNIDDAADLEYFFSLKPSKSLQNTLFYAPVSIKG